ncbi:MAG: caspase family protein [Rhizobiales bacterium]|nr:caspase family protein [Hyphomicrobiales bacterium]
MIFRIFILLIGLALTVTAAEARRVALVIGNSAYQNVTQLPNPRNDAADLAHGLQQVGFEVLLKNDLDFDALRRALRDFSDRAVGAEMALVYFAGHGIEIAKQNYLIPVDARLKTDRDVQFEAVPLDFVLSAVEGAKSLRLVLLDACRNNPFAGSMKMTNPNRSIGRGLSSIEPTAGTLVSYAAKEGTTADDGEGRNSPYTTALLANLTEPGLEVNFLFRKVRDHVLNATGGRQEPFTYGSLPGKRIYLKPPQQNAGDQNPPVTQQAPAKSLDREVWETIRDSKSPGVLQAFINRFPDSIYATLAKAKLSEVHQAAVVNDPPRQIDPDQGAGDGMPNGPWAVVAGSYPRSQQWKANQRRDWLRQNGVWARTVDTDNYQNLRNGLWAVIVGPTTRTVANRQLGAVRRVVADAYLKRAR